MGDFDLEEFRKQCLTNLYSCTDNISKYLDSDSAQECYKQLKGSVKEYCKLDIDETSHNNAMQSIQESDLDSLESKYEDEMLRQKNVRVNFKQHPYMVDLERHIEAAQRTQATSDDIAHVETINSYIDQISQRPIQIPVRNIICKHVYEKETIEDFIKKKPRKCPYAGCTNKEKISIEHLVIDNELREIIASRDNMQDS